MATMMMKKPERSAPSQQQNVQAKVQVEAQQNAIIEEQKQPVMKDVQEQHDMNQQDVKQEEQANHIDYLMKSINPQEQVLPSDQQQQAVQQDPSQEYKYSLYNPPRESQQVVAGQVNQFDPVQFRYPSLHSPESLYVKYDGQPSQQIANGQQAYPVFMQPQMMQQQQVQSLGYKTDQIDKFYQESEKQFTPTTAQLNGGNQIINDYVEDQRSESFVSGSIILEDYFEKQARTNKLKEQSQPLIVSEEPKKLTQADKIRMEMEALNLLMKQKQESILSVVEEKTSGVKIPPKSIEEQLVILPSKHIQGSNYVIHMVSHTDTLDGISIRYNVRKDLIRKANQFTGDEIYMKRELVIPFSDGPLFKMETSATVSEEQKKKDLIDRLNFNLTLKYKDQSDYYGEAQYYLENADYDYDRAMADFEEDLKFEKDFDSKHAGQPHPKRVMKR
eukprot:403343183